MPCPAPEPYRRSAALSMLHRATTQRLGCGRPATPRRTRLIIVTEVRRPAAGIQRREAWNTMRKPGCAAADAVQTAGQWDGEAIPRGTSTKYLVRVRVRALNGASVEPGTGAEGISGAEIVFRCIVHAKKERPHAPIRKGESLITHDRPPTTYRVRGVYGLREATAREALRASAAQHVLAST